MLRLYLTDRLSMIVLFYVHSFFIILVATLTISFTEASSSWTSFFYLLLLSTFFLAVGLLIDYFRRRPILKRLNEMDAHHFSPDSSRKLAAMTAPDNQTKMMLQMLQRSEDHHLEQLDQYEAQRQQHETFVNQWVHHMKTPMSVISLLTQQGKEQLDDPKAREFLNDIHDENDRFRHGLELMLHLVRLDHFSVDFHAEKVDVSKLIRELVNEERRQFIRRKLYPEIIEETDDSSVYSDSKWLRVILHQLLLNALRYSHSGEGANVTFRIYKNGDRSYVEVIDRGIGIPSHDVPRIFDPFYTGDNGREKTESTGMGLYLAQNISKHLGHTLYADSEHHKGTTMTIAFVSKTL